MEDCQLFTNKYSVVNTVEYVVLFDVVDALHCVITDNSICCLYMLIMAMIPFKVGFTVYEFQNTLVTFSGGLIPWWGGFPFNKLLWHILRLLD